MGKANRERVAREMAEMSEKIDAEQSLLNAIDKQLDRYTHVIVCKMPNNPHIAVHGCYETELEEQYMDILKKQYKLFFGMDITLTNSRRSDGKVITQEEIMKTLNRAKNAGVAISGHPGVCMGWFQGGHYEFMHIYFMKNETRKVA